MLYSLLGKYQCFRGTCSCHIQGISCPENGGGGFILSVHTYALNVQHHIPVVDVFVKNEDGVDSTYCLYLQV